MRPWTKEEEDFVRRNCVAMKYVDIAKALGRTRKSVLRRIQFLGLKPQLDRTRIVRATIVRMSAKGRTSDSEISKALDAECGIRLAPDGVASHRRELGIVFPAEPIERAREYGQKQAAELRRKCEEYASSSGWPESLLPRQLRLLNALAMRGPMTKKELSAAIDQSFHGVQITLRELRKLGAVVNMTDTVGQTAHHYFIRWEWIDNVKRSNVPAAAASGGNPGQARLPPQANVGSDH